MWHRRENKTVTSLHPRLATKHNLEEVGEELAVIFSELFEFELTIKSVMEEKCWKEN
ncbi:MAG: hypothetical protein IPO48_19190 [Saprospiraceae bacterium]|nr:hypothetical protein [Saprospiraceae bacterium]